jgi:predicted Zn-dependent protease
MLLAVSLTASAQQNFILSAVKSEIDRSKSELKLNNLRPPFLISYTVADIKITSISATAGALVYTRDNNYRAGLSKFFVGDYVSNNSNFGNFMSVQDVSMDDDAKGIAISIWEDMDRLYKNAAEAYEAKQAAKAQQQLDAEEAALPDMEQTPPVNILLPPMKTNLDKDYWNDYARKASEITNKYPDITASRVNILVRNVMSYTCNTEGTQIAVPHSYHMVHLYFNTMTDDGQELSRNLYIERSDFKDMPSLKTFTDSCEIIINNLLKLRNAPIINEAYSGPVMFEGIAVAETFQQYFFTNNSLIASRKPIGQQGGGNSIETIKDKKLVSRSLSIKSLSGAETYKGHKLEGYFPVDDDGVVPDKELYLVENGVLKNMLNGRTPTKKFQHSNGHARFSFHSHSIRTVPGNILLSSNNTFSHAELKKKLLDAAREEDLEYAYIIRYLKPDGTPDEVYRVYLSDGHEELVRGVTYPDLNMKSFKRVLGASDKDFFYSCYNFGVLTTYIVPEALLFEELEITRDNNITFKQPYIAPQPLKAE